MSYEREFTDAQIDVMNDDLRAESIDRMSHIRELAQQWYSDAQAKADELGLTIEEYLSYEAGGSLDGGDGD